MKKRWKAAIAAGTVCLLLATGVSAFEEAAVIYQAVTGKVDVHLEEYMLQDGEEVEWTDGQQVMPGQILSKIPRIYNDGDDCYVRASVSFESSKESSVPLTAANLEGMDSQWILCGDYFYYRNVLKKTENVDLFQGIRIPEQWKSGIDDGNSWKAKVKVDAIQADFFQPDFTSEDPWRLEEGGYRILKANEEEPIRKEKEEEPVVFEIDPQMKGFSVNSQEFFRELGTFLPGESQNGELKLSNRTDQPREVFLKSEILEENALLDEMELTVQVCRQDQTTVLYQGPLCAKTLTEYQSLGEIEGNGTRSIQFLVRLPEEADNAYAAKQGKVKFVLTTEAPAADVEPVETGDRSPLWNWGVLFLAVCGMTVGLIGGVRRKHAEKMF